MDVDVHLSLYRVRRWRGQPFNACPAEHDRIGWFALEDLPHLELAHPGVPRDPTRPADVTPAAHALQKVGRVGLEVRAIFEIFDQSVENPYRPE